jgi:hypothetical protein
VVLQLLQHPRALLLLLRLLPGGGPLVLLLEAGQQEAVQAGGCADAAKGPLQAEAAGTLEWLVGRCWHSSFGGPA